MDFGFSINNLTTIEGVLQVNLGGSVYPNSCYYSGPSPASTLRFANTVDYQVNAGDYTWGAGALYSGLPGIPYNVEVNNTGTDLNVNTSRGVRNNLTITDGTLTLAMGIGDFNVGGNWTRTGSASAFSPGNNTVILDGNADQTITCTASSNKETFFGLDISNNDLTPEVILAGSTSIEATYQLYLTSGIITTGSNEVYVSNIFNGAIIFQPSNASANSWINGNLRRKLTIGNYDFPVGTSVTASAAGYELISLNFSSNSNVDNLLVSFTIDNSSSSSNEPYSVIVNSTPITDRLNAGWWTIRPYDAALGLVGLPNCSYDIFLNERGHTNSQLNPQEYAVIKRDASYCYDMCATAWTQCGVHNNFTQTEAGGTAHAERSGYTCNSFSDWSIGFAPVILPIELTTFDVTSSDDDAILTWLTAAEYNSDFFAVERSTDGINFGEIGRVTAAGQSSLMRNYSFIDYSISELAVTKIYYRLRMVDLDQSYKYSEVRLVDLNGSMEHDVIVVYPNPFTDNANILWNAFADASAAIQLVDVAGRVIVEKHFEISQGANVISPFEIHSLAAGVYFLHIISGREVLCQKLVKEK
jgi:hypothetical protein